MLAYLPSLIFLLLTCAAIWVSSRRFGHPISPFSIFYGVWFFTLALFFLGWVQYTPVRQQAWQLIVLNLVSFGCGWLLAYLFQHEGISKSRVEFAVEKISAVRLRTVIYLSFTLGMIGLADFLRRVHALLGLATYLVAPHEIREAMGIGGGLDEGIKPFNWLNVSTVVLGACYLSVFRGERRKLVWVILFSSIVATLFIQDRMRFFFALLWTSYFLVHLSRWRMRKLLLIGVALVSVLGLQFYVVASWLGKVALNNQTLLGATILDESFYPLLTPYASLTGSYPAFQAYLDTQQETTQGRMTFYPVFRFFKLLDPSLKLPQILADPVSIPSEFNTFTWLHQFYNDFGVSGVILGPFVVAVLSGLMYFYMLRTKSLYSIYSNGLISFGLTLSFYGNLITEGPTWYFLAIGILIARFIAKEDLTT